MSAADRVCLVFAAALGLAIVLALVAYPPDDEPIVSGLHREGAR